MQFACFCHPDSIYTSQILWRGLRKEVEFVIAIVPKDDKVWVVIGELLAKEAERALRPRRPAEPDPGNAGGGRFAKSFGTGRFGKCLS